MRRLRQRTERRRGDRASAPPEKPVLHPPLPPAVSASTAVTAAAVAAVAPVPTAVPAVAPVPAVAAVAVAAVAAVTSAVAVLLLRGLDDDRAVAHAVERAVRRDGHEVGDRPEVGVVKGHVPGGAGRVGPEHLGRALLGAHLQPVAGTQAGH